MLCPGTRLLFARKTPPSASALTPPSFTGPHLPHYHGTRRLSQVGTGLEKWITSSVTSMDQTFRNAVAINADLGGWSLSKVTTIFSMFDKAASFTGVGVNKWSTGAVTDISYTFEGATKMNADVSTWNVDKVTAMTDTFTSTTSLTACNKRKIAGASSWKGNSAFVASYKTSWAAEKCACPVGQEWKSVVAPAACKGCSTGEFKTASDSSQCAPHTITKCSAGEGFQTGDATKDGTCAACAPGQFSGGLKPCQHFSLDTCGKGQGWVQGTATADTSCAPCGIGFFSTTVSADPCTSSSCPGGEYLVSMPDEPQSCSTTCDAGMYTGVNACVPCAPGTHNNIPKAKTCSGTPCVAGTYGPAGSTLQADATCTPCAQGMYSSSGKAIASIHLPPFLFPCLLRSMLAPLRSHSPHFIIRLAYSNSPHSFVGLRPPRFAPSPLFAA